VISIGVECIGERIAKEQRFFQSLSDLCAFALLGAFAFSAIGRELPIPLPSPLR
jgi:hypothetical protein